VSGRTRVVLFAVGSVLFAYLVSRIGLGPLVHDAAMTGWMFVPILLLYGVTLACNTATWRLILAGEPRRPSFARLYGILVSGFALNFVTPMVNVGGEPFRIAAVAPWTGTRRAAGSVIMHTVLRTLSFLLTWLTALALGFVFLPHDLPIRAALVATTLVVVVLIFLLLSGHRRGALEKLLNLLHRVPGAGRLARALEPRREALVHIDAQLALFSSQHPARFWGGLSLEYAARAIYMAEYYLIGLSIGIPLGFAKAYLVGGLVSLIQNILFMIPFEVGAKEGSLYLLFGMVGLDPRLGVYTAIVTRVRDIVWIAAGLLLLGSAGRVPRARPGAAT
jgi:uncharacterized protein (TIRG00374 family)